MRAAARATLSAGVTTIRDLGDRDYLALRVRAETAADPAAGPTVLAAGPPDHHARRALLVPRGEVSGVDAIRAAVRERAERGVDVIKVMASGGGLTPGSHLHQPQYDPAVLAAGFDTIEYCSWATEDGIAPDDAVIAEIVANGIAVSLTVGVVPGGPPPENVRSRIAVLVTVSHTMRDVG